MRAIAIAVTALAAIAAAFFVGRATAPGSAPVIAVAPLEPVAGPATEQAPLAREALPSPDPRARLLSALQQSGEERDRAVRQAMIAWLAADGAGAIRSAREHPELSGEAERMVRLALYAYPEIFQDDPSLLDDDPDRERLISMSVGSIAGFDPELARVLVNRHLADGEYGVAMLGAVDHFESLAGPAPSLSDARTELESILAESNMMKRLPRLMMLLERMASSDPASAAQLIDEMPRSSSTMAIDTLVHRWSQSDPQAAADWLAGKDAQIARQGWPALAQVWGRRELDAASAYADNLTGTARTAFLRGLAAATAGMPTGTTQAWLSKYRDDPVYADLVRGVAGQLAQHDIRAAMSLIEELPTEQRLRSYGSVIPMLAMQDPEAAVDLVNQLEDDARSSLIPMVVSMWAQNDAQAALGWASDRPRGQTRDSAISQVASVLAWIDPDLAIDAIDEVDDPQVRKATVSQLLVQLESEQEAVRVGRRYDFDRDAVLALRERDGPHFDTVGAIYFEGLPPD